jgi:outer membrane protein assembly factor BamA
MDPGGTFRPPHPTTFQVFPGEPGISDSFQPNYLHGEASVTRDTRNHRSWPTRGGMYRAALTVYDDTSTNIGNFSFQQFEVEGTQLVPVNDRGWVLALHGWVVACDVPSGHTVPFYLLPSLGGHNTLRGYDDYRFHDRSMAVVNAESRWALFTHLDGAVFVDAGNVAPNAGNLNLDKTSWGAGLRLHTSKATFARFDVAYSVEGWHFVFRTSDLLRFSRLTRRVAAVPFVP